MPAAGAAGVLAARFMTAALLLAVCTTGMFLLPNRWWAAALLLVTAIAAWEWGVLAGYGRVLRWTFCVAIFFLAVAIYLATDAGRVMVIQDVDLEFAVYAA